MTNEIKKYPHMRFPRYQLVKERLGPADLLQSSSRKPPLRRTSQHANTDQHMIPLHW